MCCLVICLVLQNAVAVEYQVLITDQRGLPLENAVVSLHRDGFSSLSAEKNAPTATMDQVGKQFVPHVLAVRAGTIVDFPNSDDIRHQVYSFSPTKKFTLPLYHGTPAERIMFEQAGVVALGCNIHDRMLAYIVVVDADHFAVSDEVGISTILDIKPGDYQLNVWHSSQVEQAVERTLSIEAGKDIPYEIKISVKESMPVPELTPLELKFRAIEK